eukprot:6198525-Pleurochrysis_carterae.AAC.2
MEGQISHCRAMRETERSGGRLISISAPARLLPEFSTGFYIRQHHLGCANTLLSSSEVQTHFRPSQAGSNSWDPANGTPSAIMIMYFDEILKVHTPIHRHIIEKE